MRMKSILAASTALALVAAAPVANADDLYVSVFGGLNMLADDSGPTDGNVGTWNSDADTGFVLGGAIGTSLSKWAQGLRVELEASYRRNDLGGDYRTDTSANPDTGTILGNMSTFAIMANAWYEFDIGSKVRPYVGGGVGWARMHGDMQALTSGGDSDTYTSDVDYSGFAWQLGLGGRYEVANGVDVGLGYRYFNGPSFNDFFGGSYGRLDNENHAVQVELNIAIQ